MLSVLSAISVLAFAACGADANQESAKGNHTKVQRMMAGDGEDANPDDTSKRFCGVPPAQLIDLIRNYKKEVWMRTSDESKEQLDARFVELDINELENFLEYAKRNAEAAGKKISSVRMYYINYEGEKKTQEYLNGHTTGNVFEDFSGCHSVALVPVVGDSLTDPNRRDYYYVGQNMNAPTNYNDLSTLNNANQQGNPNMILIPNYDCNRHSTVDNHSALCPPLTGCTTNTLLITADNE